MGKNEERNLHQEFGEFCFPQIIQRVGEHFSAAVIRYDLEGRHRYVSSGIRDLFSVSLDELAGKHFEEVDCFSGFREELERKFRCILASSSRETLEVVFGKKVLLWTFYPERGEGEELCGVLVIVQDITQKKRTEGHLFLSEKILASLPELISVIDRDYSYRYMNSTFRRYHGIEEGRREIFVWEVWGEGFFESRMRDHIGRCFQGERVYYEFWYEFRNRGKKFIEVSYFPLYKGGGTSSKEIESVVAIYHDNTARRISEEAFLDSEERWRAVTENSPDYIFLLDLELRLIFLNRKGDLAKGEVIGKSILECLPSSFRKQAQRCYEGVLATKGVGEYETIFYDLEGRRRFFQVRVSPAFREGEVMCLINSATEITDRKEAEETLKYLIRFERLITKISSDFIHRSFEKMDRGIEEALRAVGEFAEVDRSYIFQFSSDRRTMSNTYEWYAEGVEPRRKRLQDLEVSCFSPLSARLLEGEVVYIRDVQDFFSRSCGGGRDFFSHPIQSVVLVPLELEGEVIGFMGLDSIRTSASWTEETIALLKTVGGILVNVLKRRAIEEQVQRLRMAVDQTDEIITIIRPEGQIIYANQALERHTGFAKEEVLGREYFSTYSGLDISLKRRIWECLRGGKAWSGWLENRRKDGSVYVEEVTISPVRSSEGEILNYVAVRRDITEKLNLEEQLRHSQKMESVGRLAGGIAHDFNNLLTPILGYTELLLMGDSGLGEEERGSLLQIQQAAQRAKELIERLLAFSRKQILNMELLSLKEVLGGVEKILRRTLRDNVELELSFPEETFWVKADRTQVEQVVMNLAINAQDAMLEGGKLRIWVEDIQLKEGRRKGRQEVPLGSYSCLVVEDTGVGIAEEDLPRIFEPFYTTKGKGRGTGLGLATVYGIVKQHGGYIEVESTPGVGSVFRVYFPHSQEVAYDEGEIPLESFASLKGKTATIMVVDDNDMVRQVIANILREYNCRVFSFSSSEAALSFVQESSAGIDLLITDVVMPKLNGPQLYRKLCERLPALKVIYISGYTGDEIAQHGISHCREHFLSKPISIQALIQKVDLLLSQ